MRIFAANEVIAKSRFFYFLRPTPKGQACHWWNRQLHPDQRKETLKIKNFGIWLRYDSRSGTHNMYKEFRSMSRVEAVQSLYMDMAACHRARFRSIQIIRVAEIETSQIRRPYIQQLIDSKIKFPVPHRVARAFKPIFAGKRPSTH